MQEQSPAREKPAPLSPMESIKEEAEHSLGDGAGLFGEESSEPDGQKLIPCASEADNVDPVFSPEQSQGSYQNGGAAPSAASSDSDLEGEEVRLLDVGRRTDSAYEGSSFGKKSDADAFVSISIRSEAEAEGGARNGRLASAKIIKAEEREEGNVKRQMYHAYLSSWGPWFWVPISVLVLAAVERSLQVRLSLLTVPFISSTLNLAFK